MSAFIGRDEYGKPVFWDFRQAVHSVIAGSTRSGKSVASYAMLSAAAGDPDVLVCGVDPSGVLLAPHRVQVPDPMIVLGCWSPVAVRQAVQILLDIMARRIDLLRAHRVDQIPASAFSPDLPIIVFVLEEYAGLLSWLDSSDVVSRTKVRIQITAGVGRLLREGAKVGIRVVTILQRPDAATLHDRAQYGRRIAMRLDNTDSVKMLHETSDAETITRLIHADPGVGLWHEAGSAPRFFRTIAMDYAEYLSSVEEPGR